MTRSERTLRFYSRFRGRRPSIVEALLHQRPAYWYGWAAMLLVVFFFFLVDGSVFPYALAAGLVGVFTRDIGALLQFKLNWPTLDRVIDWRAVESELSKS